MPNPCPVLFGLNSSDWLLKYAVCVCVYELCTHRALLLLLLLLIKVPVLLMYCGLHHSLYLEEKPNSLDVSGQPVILPLLVTSTGLFFHT